MDLISRQAAIDAIKELCLHYRATKIVIEELEFLPSARPERWNTCFSCPLSHGCPVIKGCSNDQAEQYAGEIPTDCPLDKESAQSERKTGHWVEIGDEPYDEWECDVCGFVIDGSGCINPEEYRDVYRFRPCCGSNMRGK